MKHFNFHKMQGLGNDFFIIDDQQRSFEHNKNFIKLLCDRKRGVGCDQLIILHPSQKAHCKMLIFNSDGSKAEACGNATRCVTKFICEKENTKNVKIEFESYISKCKSNGNNYTCNMGTPKTSWQDIPLADDRECSSIDFPELKLENGFAVNVGNPHIVFFVDNLDQINLAEIGQKIENHKLFPERVNVSFAKIIDNKNIKLRVWERGAGITEACGTAACATAFAAITKKLCIGPINIAFNHGNLLINLLKDGTLEMDGEAKLIFTGKYCND